MDHKRPAVPVPAHGRRHETVEAGHCRGDDRSARIPPERYSGPGFVLLGCTVLYLIPRTAVLGAILLTGYLGGAVATHVRVSAGLLEILFPVIFGALLWGGLFLRDERLRELIPRELSCVPQHTAKPRIDCPEECMKFRTTILQAGKTATGIQVPAKIVERLGAGKRPPVRVTINGHIYRSTVAVMRGAFMVGVSAVVRENARVAGGDEVEVDIELDTAPREVIAPPISRRRSIAIRKPNGASMCCPTATSGGWYSRRAGQDTRDAAAPHRQGVQRDARGPHLIEPETEWRIPPSALGFWRTLGVFALLSAARLTHLSFPREMSVRRRRRPEIRSVAHTRRSMSLFAAARVENWKEALDLAEALAGWVFRGHGDTKWEPKTRIERDASGLGRPGFTLVDRERWVLRGFSVVPTIT